MGVKLCKDCQHFSPRSIFNYCANPKLGVDLVTGEIDTTLASVNRLNNSPCSVDAKWFEQKEQEVIVATKKPKWKFW